MLVLDDALGKPVVLYMKRPYYIMVSEGAGLFPFLSNEITGNKVGSKPYCTDIIEGMLEFKPTRSSLSGGIGYYSVVYKNPARDIRNRPIEPAQIRVIIDPEDVLACYMEEYEAVSEQLPGENDGPQLP
jgi:hypothetical protein